MKQKIKGLVLGITLILSLITSHAALADKGISVTLNGETLIFDVPPQMINERTMVPMRTIFEKLGATVYWNQETQTVTAAKEGAIVSLTIGQPAIIVNGSKKDLDISPCIVDERTLVPVRAISEAFDMKVYWDGTNKTVIISSSDITSTSNSPAFNTLKNKILSSGTSAPDGNGKVIYIFEDIYSFLMTYHPDRDKIGLFLTITYDGGSESSVLINLENDEPWVLSTYTTSSGEEYTTYGYFSNSSNKFVETSSDAPEYIYNLTTKLMHSEFKLIEALIQEHVDVTFADLGMKYETY